MRFVAFTLALLLSSGAVAAPPARPNIVFILLDDLRWDELGCAGHPFVRTPNIDRLAREGAYFANAYATTPLCSPSRASILTGRYAHAHGVRDNTNHDALSHRLVTFLRLLHDAGYETPFFGKWHMGTDGSPRPGIDHWLGFKGQGEYLDPEMNQDGNAKKFKGYATDILNDRAVQFVRMRHDRPFVLYLSHKAVHPKLTQRADGSIDDPAASTFIPAERHRTLYASERIPRRPNALIDNLEGKPALMRPLGNLPPLSRATGTSDDVIRDRLRMLMAVEDGVGDLLRALEEQQQLDNTLIVFSSDHGYFYGEHGLSVERRLAYEEAARIPLLMRYPPLIKPRSRYEALVLSIDLAPTFLELGGAPRPANLHGRSLVPLLKGEMQKLRDSFLIEYFSDTVFPRMNKMGYQAVRSGQWKYIHYTDLEEMDELYDLAADPYEMHNRVGASEGKKALPALQAELRRLVQETR